MFLKRKVSSEQIFQRTAVVDCSRHPSRVHSQTESIAKRHLSGNDPSGWKYTRLLETGVISTLGGFVGTLHSMIIAMAFQTFKATDGDINTIDVQVHAYVLGKQKTSEWPSFSDRLWTSFLEDGVSWQVSEALNLLNNQVKSSSRRCPSVRQRLIPKSACPRHGPREYYFISQLRVGTIIVISALILNRWMANSPHAAVRCFGTIYTVETRSEENYFIHTPNGQRIPWAP